MKKTYLSVVIPAYNEHNNIKKGCLEQVISYLEKQSYSYEVLVVDDGSTDDTIKLAKVFAQKHKNVKVLPQPHRGKAGTVIAGMLAAEGEIVLFSDLDQATPITQLEKILPKFSARGGQNFDIVIGSRAGRKGAGLLRLFMAYGFMVLRTIILRLPYKDTQCGFKAFSKKAIKPIFQRMQVFRKQQTVEGSAVTAGFDLELLYIARKLKFSVAEVPVDWEEKGDRGKSGVNPIKDSYQGLRDMIRVRINAILGRYKI